MWNLLVTLTWNTQSSLKVIDMAEQKSANHNSEADELLRIHFTLSLTRIGTN